MHLIIPRSAAGHGKFFHAARNNSREKGIGKEDLVTWYRRTGVVNRHNEITTRCELSG
jgi:hypothetical protein